jgi:ABC-type multidrug transport system ATPase subunit
MIREQFGGRKSAEVLDLVGMTGYADFLPGRLTIGQRRRAEIAAALVRRPRCVLIDDPYRGVDSSEAADLTCLFRGMAANGAAVIVSGSEVPELLAAADRVTWCTGRKTQEMGPPRSAARSPQFRQECLSYHSEEHKMTAGSRR